MAEFKYLGVWFSTKNVGITHTKRLISTLQWKVTETQAKAAQSSDPPQVMKVLWQFAIRPSVTFGMDVLPIPKSCLDKIEALQIKSAKSTLGIHTSSSATTVRGMWKWTSIEIESHILALSSLGKILHMNDQALPKQVLQAMREAPNKFAWYKHILELLTKYDVDPQIFNTPQLRAGLRKRLEASFWSTWWEKIQAKGAWEPYTTSMGTTFNNTIQLKSRVALN